MRILVLTLMMSFLSHSAFGAEEKMEELIQEHNRLRELHRKAQAEIQFLHMDETLRQMEKDSIWILTLQIEIYLRLKTLS